MRVLAIFLGGLLFLATVQAQSDRGTITGTVTDQAGAVVPGAAVAITNTDTGIATRVSTSDTGNYTVPGLPAGPYQVTVTKDGFKRFVQSGITVQVAATARVDVGLQVGSATESITITSEAPLLKTDDAEVTHDMSGDQVSALPINFSVIAGGYVRSPFVFITNEPGANNTGQNTVRVNGMPNSTESMMVDGQEATNTNSAGGIDELQPSVESIEAVALQTSNYAPEFGQVVGGLFNFNSKSGTNSFHGSAFDYLANDDLNAGVPFTNSGNNHLIRPAVRRNDFGFSLGGPAYIPKVYDGRNKTFFFFAWEGYKAVQHISGVYQTVPTTAMRNGDFSALLTGKVVGTNPLGGSVAENMIFDPTTGQSVNGQVVNTPFPGNVIPQSRISPVAQKIQAFIPTPYNTALVNNWQQTYPTSDFQSVPSIKLDQNIGSKQRLRSTTRSSGPTSTSRPTGCPRRSRGCASCTSATAPCA